MQKQERCSGYQRYLILLLLHLLFWTVQQCSASDDEEPCKGYSLVYPTNYTQDYTKTLRYRKIQCCVHGVLGYNDPDATIEWSFQGKPLNLRDGRLQLLSRNETLLIKEVKEADDGNFTCKVTSNGTERTFTTYHGVCVASDYREGPKDIKVSRTEVCAEEGGTAKLTCEGLVGKPGCGDGAGAITWMFQRQDGTLKLANRGTIKRYTDPRIDRGGVIRRSLEFPSVAKEHFGTYLCVVKNDYNYLTMNISLIEGDPENCGNPRTPEMVLMTGITAIGMLLWFLYSWFRWRRTLSVVLMDNKRKRADGFQYDVFVVYGKMASKWVHEFLLPNLQQTYGYSCFDPDRDMYAGEQIAETISATMFKCRRVLVVINPCLLTSQWATWAVHQGIRTCLTSTSGILAVVLQDFGSDAVSSETTGLLETLKEIKKIRVPKSCRGHETEDPEPPRNHRESPCKKTEDDLKSFFKIRTSGSSLERPTSPSTKNQLMSNMITVSNNASREHLSVKNRENPKGSPEIYLEKTDGLEDPGSPCSITPFILPSCSKLCNRPEHPEPYNFNCLRDVFLGDPEVIFWQKVRLQLDLPTARRRTITAETIA